MRKITELDNQYAGQILWVVGRGPSLARLTRVHIGPGPVVAINQAISRVEKLKLPNPLYSMQKDRFFTMPEQASVLLHTRESLISCGLFEPENVYSFDAPQDYGLPWDVPSVVVCAALARRWGCVEVIYLCCDAAVSGDTGAYGEQPTYPANYLVHGPLVRRYARIPVEWKRI